MEKYLSGTTHPSEIFEAYKALDVYDKERFVRMLLDDKDSTNILNDNYWYEKGYRDDED